MKRIQLATYLVLGLSAVPPLAFIVYHFLYYSFSELLGFPQSITVIALLLFVIGPYVFAIFMLALLPKNKAPSITMFVGSLLISAFPWLSAILLVWRQFTGSLHHDLPNVTRFILVGSCCQWPLVFITAAIVCLLGGRAFRRQAILMFVGMAFLFAIFLLFAMFSAHNELTMTYFCWLGLLAVVVLVFLLAHTKPRLAKAEA